jgi:hypothetical protein
MPPWLDFARHAQRCGRTILRARTSSRWFLRLALRAGAQPQWLCDACGKVQPVARGLCVIDDVPLHRHGVGLAASGVGTPNTTVVMEERRSPAAVRSKGRVGVGIGRHSFGCASRHIAQNVDAVAEIRRVIPEVCPEHSSQRATPASRMNLHKADCTDARTCRRLQLVVLRQHHSEHESWRESPTISLTDCYVGEAPGSRLVHFAGAKQIAHETLAVCKKLWSAERHVDRCIQPRGSKCRVDIVMAKNRLYDRGLTDEHGMHPRHREDQCNERGSGEDQ